MLSSFYTEISSSVQDTGSTERAPAPQSIPLNFLSAIGAIVPNKIYHPGELGLSDREIVPGIAGSGGCSVVQIGRLREDSVDKLVAVKGPQNAAQSSGPRPNESRLLDAHFNQLTLELRILGHDQLIKHPNIVNLLGICMDGKFQMRSLALVLEYSRLGNLRNFLLHQSEDTCSLQARERFDLARQVAEGLKSLHEFQICHGDVKLDNVLVFHGEEETLVAKVSDFGQCVVNASDQGTVQIPRGTPLLNAPELRKGDWAGLTFIAALQTDIFSFGLLVWEIMNDGHSYLNQAWLDANPGVTGEADVEAMERFLDSLPQNKLLAYGEQFLLMLNLDAALREQTSRVLNGCLQDEYSRRKPMSIIVNEMSMSKTDDHNLSNRLPLAIENLDETLGDWDDFAARLDNLKWTVAIMAWSVRESLYTVSKPKFPPPLTSASNWLRTLLSNCYRQISLSTFGTSVELRKFPWRLQQQILYELQSLATSPAASEKQRGHAAMTVSECYTLGFGTAFDRSKCLRWLAIAASEGDPKARLWYYRVCESFSMDPDPGFSSASDRQFEDQLSQVPTELYLINRLHEYNARRLKNTRESVLQSVPLHIGTSSNMNFFEEWDAVSPIHLAALYGDDSMITDCLRGYGGDTADVKELSYRGYNAVHYACMGGHLSTLRLLLASGGDATGRNDQDVTPLHLAVLFPLHETRDVVDTLVKHGANPNFASDELLWADVNILITGPPLRWAVSLRNRVLAHALLQYSNHTTKSEALQLALSLYFWEIAEDLLNDYEVHGGIDSKVVLVPSIKHPFRHWISHGKDSSIALRRTVGLCYDHGLFAKPGNDWVFNRNLDLVFNTMRTEDDLYLIEALWRTWSSISPESCKGPYLRWAIFRSGHNGAWRPTLEMLANVYSVEELNEPIIQDDDPHSLLHEAVSEDAIVAVRVLLKRGVDVNQPMLATHRTALHLCAHFDVSREMWELLLEFGAAVDARNIGGLTPIQTAFGGYRPTLDAETSMNVLQYVPNDDAYMDLLHTLVHNLSIDSRSRFSMEDFRMVLSQDRAQAYINLPNTHGITLLLQATLQLRSDAVKLLLEANADANVGYHGGIEDSEATDVILPFQLALWFGLDSKFWPFKKDTNGLEKAYEVARELLLWHHTNRDVDFAAITPLHVACLLQLRPEVDRLISTAEEEGSGTNSSGEELLNAPISWLSLDDDNRVVTAAMLLTCESLPERIAYVFPGRHNLARKMSLLQKLLNGMNKSFCKPQGSSLDPNADCTYGRNVKLNQNEVAGSLGNKGGSERDSPHENNSSFATWRKAIQGNSTWRSSLKSLLLGRTRGKKLDQRASAASDAKDGHGNQTPLSSITTHARHVSLDQRVNDHSGLTDRSKSQTPLIVAAKSGKEAIVEALLKQGAKADSEATGYHEGRTPLSFAAEKGDEAIVNVLLSYGANPNSKAADSMRGQGWTPLNFAAQRGHEAIIKLLLDHGANPNTTAAGSYAPLRSAIEFGGFIAVKLLLDHGANPNPVIMDTIEDMEAEWIPLIKAVTYERTTIVKLLLDRGADADVEGPEYEANRTALSLAAERGFEAIVKMLLQCKVEIDSKAKGELYGGRTPLSFAAERGHKGVVKLLLDQGADVDCQATDHYDGRTPLSVAAEGGHEGVVQLLLDHGADIDCKATAYHKDKTPLNFAADKGHEDVVQLMLEHKQTREQKAES